MATAALAAGLVAVAVTQQVSRAAASAALDPETLPQHLTGTGLNAADDPSTVAPGVRQFLPQYPLWSDGLTKRRWVSMPEGASIDATSSWRGIFLSGRSSGKSSA
jgi:hypothetical protein